MLCSMDVCRFRVLRTRFCRIITSNCSLVSASDTLERYCRVHCAQAEIDTGCVWMGLCPAVASTSLHEDRMHFCSSSSPHSSALGSAQITSLSTLFCRLIRVRLFSCAQCEWHWPIQRSGIPLRPTQRSEVPLLPPLLSKRREMRLISASTSIRSG